MVRLIMGANGAGKTKQLIELMHTSVSCENGSVVCIEANANMTYDLSYNIRLVTAGEYSIDSFTCLRGFISGLYAGNYDISNIYVDNLCKIARSDDFQEIENFLNWLDTFSEKNGVKFTVTVSAEESAATEGMKAYL
jgi:archaellum biogenesis ATPase FlaH